MIRREEDQRSEEHQGHVGDEEIRPERRVEDGQHRENQEIAARHLQDLRSTSSGTFPTLCQQSPRTEPDFRMASSSLKPVAMAGPLPNGSTDTTCAAGGSTTTAEIGAGLLCIGPCEGWATAASGKAALGTGIWGLWPWDGLPARLNASPSAVEPPRKVSQSAALEALDMGKRASAERGVSGLVEPLASSAARLSRSSVLLMCGGIQCGQSRRRLRRLPSGKVLGLMGLAVP
eukprot:scaffold1311_cov256-Pinguiococcus_pyrenoidosus.AAC.25